LDIDGGGQTGSEGGKQGGRRGVTERLVGGGLEPRHGGAGDHDDAARARRGVHGEGGGRDGQQLSAHGDARQRHIVEGACARAAGRRKRRWSPLVAADEAWSWEAAPGREGRASRGQQWQAAAVGWEGATGGCSGRWEETLNLIL
jgi:hypothetical protein